MAAPLPTACKTALALLAKGEQDAMKTYDGSGYDDEAGKPEKDELCLARLWPDYEMLAAEPQHVAVSPRLYQPLLEWMATEVEVFPLTHTFEEAAAA